MPSLQSAHVQRIYRPLSVVFLGLVSLTLAGVVYAGLSETTITVTPLRRQVDTSFTVTVGPSASADQSLQGTVSTSTLTEVTTITPHGTGTPQPAHATGRVTFHNTTARPQPLAAGTRLRASSGVIVRTTKRVDVPAGGTVGADVVADPLGLEGEVPAGRFVIVALWPGLQDKIYADSSAALTGGLAASGTSLALDELTAASNAAEKKIEVAFGPSTSGRLKALIPTAVSTDPLASVQSASYSVTVTMKGVDIRYPAADITALITDRLTELLADDERLAAVAAPELAFERQLSDNEAEVTVRGRGWASLTASSPLLRASQFVGLDRSAIVRKLLGSKVVKDVAVDISPWWRSAAPTDPRRITVLLTPAQP